MPITQNPFLFALRWCFREKWKDGSHESFAATIGVGQSTVTRLLSGKIKGSQGTQTKVAEAFGYSLGEFLSLGERLIAGEQPSVEDERPNEGVVIKIPIQRAHRPMDISEPEAWVAEALGMAWAVLESGTKTAEALRLNIEEFFEKVQGQAGKQQRKKPSAGARGEGQGHRRVANGE